MDNSKDVLLIDMDITSAYQICHEHEREPAPSPFVIRTIHQPPAGRSREMSPSLEEQEIVRTGTSAPPLPGPDHYWTGKIPCKTKVLITLRVMFPEKRGNVIQRSILPTNGTVHKAADR